MIVNAAVQELINLRPGDEIVVAKQEEYYACTPHYSEVRDIVKDNGKINCINMTRLTLLNFQTNYPDNIRIDKSTKDDYIYFQCYLLRDKEIHKLLFSGKAKTVVDLDKLIEELKNYKL